MAAGKALGKTYKIVLTGGPCAGKTTIAELVGRAFNHRLIVVPESASLLFRGGFPRWDEPSGRSALQSAIYRVQLEMEKAYESHFAGRVLLLDRGTVDGAAYWPAGPDHFFTNLNTSPEQELARYDEVIYLESASEEDYGIHSLRNPSRTENWTEARELDGRTRSIWERHPMFHVVQNKRAFSDKIFEVLKVIENSLSRAN